MIAMGTAKTAEEMRISDAGSMVLEKAADVFEKFVAEQYRDCAI